MWDLSSLSRNWTCVLCWGGTVLTTGLLDRSLLAGCFDDHIKDTRTPSPNRTQNMNMPTNCTKQQAPPKLTTARRIQTATASTGPSLTTSEVKSSTTQLRVNKDPRNLLLTKSLFSHAGSPRSLGDTRAFSGQCIPQGSKARLWPHCYIQLHPSLLGPIMPFFFLKILYNEWTADRYI